MRMKWRKFPVGRGHWRVHECIDGSGVPSRAVCAGVSARAAQSGSKNGWQLAEQAGNANGVQRLLYNYRWDRTWFEMTAT